jgi:hypothetical protein
VVVAEGVARSKSAHAKQELARVKTMSAAQVMLQATSITTLVMIVIVITVTLFTGLPVAKTS